jgi:hypothetical protein
MKTRIEGHTKKSVVITSDGKQTIIECEDAIVKFWLSSGTIIGMKYDSLLHPNVWKIRILCGPADNEYIHRQRFADDYFDLTDCCGSDVFETNEEVINMKVIPRTYYAGDDV